MTSLQRAFYLLSGAALLFLAACITPQPRIAPPPGLYNCPATVNITDSKTGAAIFYTTDGNPPTTSSPKYSSSFPVNSSEKVQAIALAPGLKVSPLAAADYTCSSQVTTVAFAGQIQQRFSLPPPAAPLHFSDLSPNDPNYAAAQAIAPFLNRQILCHGCFLSRNFVPNQPLQRASSSVFFVSFLLAQKKIQLLSSKEADNILASVPDANTLPGVTARRYVATALKNNLLPLHERNTLDGVSPISPTEMTTVLQTIQNNFNLPPASLQ